MRVCYIGFPLLRLVPAAAHFCAGQIVKAASGAVDCRFRNAITAKVVSIVHQWLKAIITDPSAASGAAIEVELRFEVCAFKGGTVVPLPKHFANLIVFNCRTSARRKQNCFASPTFVATVAVKTELKKFQT